MASSFKTWLFSWRNGWYNVRASVCEKRSHSFIIFRQWYGQTKERCELRYFEECCVVLWRGWCGTLKSVVWYFEEGGVVLWRVLCGTLKRVVWYFEEGGVVLWRRWCGTLKRVVWYFEEDGVVLWRGSSGKQKKGVSCKKLSNYSQHTSLAILTTRFVYFF